MPATGSGQTEQATDDRAAQFNPIDRSDRILRTYRVFKTPHPIPVNGDVEKPVWQQTAALEIACAQPKTGSHCPRTHVKVRYDDDFVYVLFQTADQFVRAVAMDTHGEVWKDSCVEFFFTPQCDLSKGYFNLEINCIGTLLMRYQAPKRSYSLCGQERLRANQSGRLYGSPGDTFRDSNACGLDCRMCVAGGDPATLRGG